MPRGRDDHAGGERRLRKFAYNDPVGSKAVVQGAVGTNSGDPEAGLFHCAVEFIRPLARSNHNNVAGGRQRHVQRLIHSAKVDDGCSALAERHIGLSVGGEPPDDPVLVGLAGVSHTARRDDHAVGLHHEFHHRAVIKTGRRSETRVQNALVAKGSVQLAISGQTNNHGRQVLRVQRRGPRQQHPAVFLHRDSAGHRQTTGAEADGNLSALSERGVA